MLYFSDTVCVFTFSSPVSLPAREGAREDSRESSKGEAKGPSPIDEFQLDLREDMGELVRDESADDRS